MTYGDRKKAEKDILNLVSSISTYKKNIELYKAKFAKMSDKEFHEMMVKFDEGKGYPNIVVPVRGDYGIDVKRNIKLFEEIGYEFETKQVLMDDDGFEYISPVPVVVLELPYVKPKQDIYNSVSVPEHNRIRSSVTNQVIGVSAAAKVSGPEVQVLSAIGANNTLEELIVVRGGDVGGSNRLHTAIEKTGQADLRDIREHYVGTGATSTLEALFMAAHIRLTGKKQ